MAVCGLLGVSSVTHLPYLPFLVLAHRCAVFYMVSGFALPITSNLFAFPDVVLPFSLSFLWGRGGGGYLLA